MFWICYIVVVAAIIVFFSGALRGNDVENKLPYNKKD